MSARRAPLSANANAANSPMRPRPAAALAAVLDRHRQQKRAHASLQREEPYGQPPPPKKQLLNDRSKEAVRFPPPLRQLKVQVKRESPRPPTDQKPSQSASTRAAQHEEEMLRMHRWRESTRHSFPGYVFYFESAPDDKRAKLVRQIAQLGGREEKFFSKDITHVVTTRNFSADSCARSQPDPTSGASQTPRAKQDMPTTVDPSLLSRDVHVKDVRRRLLESGRKRPPVPAAQESAMRPPTNARIADILVRAHEMKKKIWSYTKLCRVLEVMFDSDPLGTNGGARKNVQADLAQLLNKERATGPSDRDPTVSTKELHYFKGPYIYIYDIEEKLKPIMVREYAKVADKKDGDWPQFRATKDGRCPFVEVDARDRQRLADKEAYEKQRQARRERALAEAALEPNAPPSQLGQAVARSTATKRTLSEMQDSNARAGVSAPAPDVFDLATATHPLSLDFRAFTSKAKSARLLGGEPVASGIQQSNVTSAIRSQMISSATGVLGAKAGTSKELQGLQRKVLQKGSLPSANPTTQDKSARRPGAAGVETSHYGQRSASLGMASRKLGPIEEDSVKHHKRTMSVPVAAPAKPKKRELKPGYCENCQDKFDDFDQHILVKKHRKFAEDPRNWSQLDTLLSQLARSPKYTDVDEEATVGPSLS